MTVVVLTSGTSFTIPADWTAVNQVETWGGGGGGGSANSGGFDGGGGGSCGYSSVSNLAGLSGSVTIAIGAAGTAGTTAGGGTGGDTWFNGATLAASSVGSHGGGGGTAAGVGGAGGSTTGAIGTTKTAGTTGGAGSSSLNIGGGGSGAPGPHGAGGAGGAGSGTPTGGAGDAGSGGAGGAAGSGGTGNGGPGGSNANGGGGGGGGTDIGSLCQGGDGGLPGAGGGGGGQFSTTHGGAGAGGQIRITYTPAANQVLGSFTDLPTSRRKDKWKGLDEQYDMQGWQLGPLSASSLPEIRQQPLEVPPGRWNWTRYQDWQRSPTVPELDIIGRVWTDPPQRTWVSGRHSYAGWQQGVIPDEFLVPLPVTDAPRGGYNAARYQDIQAGPQPASVQFPPIQPQTDLPTRSWDRRMQYQGTQLAPQPQIMSPPQPVYDVPAGRWNAGRYQDFQQGGILRREFDVPAPVVNVPWAKSKFDYTEWQAFQIPSSVLGPLSSSAFYDLPPTSRLQALSRYSDLFRGFTASPTPPDVIRVIPRTFLPLMGVGSYGP